MPKLLTLVKVFADFKLGDCFHSVLLKSRVWIVSEWLSELILPKKQNDNNLFKRGFGYLKNPPSLLDMCLGCRTDLAQWL